MLETLQTAQYLIAVAIVFIVIALGIEISVVTRRRKVTQAPSPKVLVAVGPQAAEAEVDGQEALGTSSLDHPIVEAVVAPNVPGSNTVAGGTPGTSGTRLLRSWYAIGFISLALLALSGYLGVRMSVTGHGPFSNQHEFAVSFSWGILLVFLFFLLRHRVDALSLVVLPVAAVLLVYSMSLDMGVKPLVPALQNKLLLTLHVGFAIVAYGAACVSFGAAVLYLLRPYLSLRVLPRQEILDELGYRAAVVTFPLLTIMILLGSVWAQTAWGRYWGWDPKETAALVTWLIYGAYLHARVARNWRGNRSAWLLIIGFLAVLFAYFGNHFFGGLHSYG
ncbi:MAG: c-type cytochrome biogenesis protein CcsB [Actinomycetaceae bacterium]|nr:c-type cytochrome biogenesis protein CcsB [Actinomycetaceae bacterium]